MNVLVLLKQVPDPEIKIKISPDGNSIQAGDVKWVINPYDEFAIEEALKIREKLKAGTVTVISGGADRSVEALRTAIAMGADNAIHIKLDDKADCFLVAKALAAVCQKETYGLVLAGKQATDDDQSAVFAYVAEFLNLPSISAVIKLEIGADGKALKAERLGEDGKYIMESPLPAMIAVADGINTPRYASLPGIMKAKKKEIKAVTLSDLGLGSETARTQDSSYALPPERKTRVDIPGDAAAQAKELVRLLREEAKVI